MNKKTLTKLETLIKQGYEEFSENEAHEVSNILDAILPTLGLDYGMTINKKADGSENWLLIV